MKEEEAGQHLPSAPSYSHITVLTVTTEVKHEHHGVSTPRSVLHLPKDTSAPISQGMQALL